MSLPKVLIIGQSFNNDTGGGITLTNLFAGWDRDKLAVACSGYLLLNNIDTSICNTYYQLGHKENKWLFPFNYLKRKYYSGLLKFDDKKIQDFTIAKSKIRVKLIMNYFYPFLEYVGLSHLISKIELSNEFCTWIDKYQPDVIYAQTSGRADTLFCIALQSYLKKPLIFHMMDDWPATISSKGPFKGYWQRKIDHELKILLDKASVLMSISDYMAQGYKSRYGKEFITFNNTINIKFWKKHQKTDYEINNSPTILYAGRIGLGIQSSLEKIAKVIQSINEKLNMSIKFILQTAKKPLWSKRYSCVVHNNFVCYNDLPQLFSEADLLLLPYDFSKKSKKFIQYSMPTKAPEYMMSGTPILLFAPQETAVVKYAEKYEWAKIVAENNAEELSVAIIDLIQNKNIRTQIAQNAKQIAEENHNSMNVSKEFKSRITSLVIK